MVAERFLDFRKLDFSLSPLRAHLTMASPTVAEVSLAAPMLNWEANTASLNDYVQMGSAGAAAGAIVIQAMLMGGGRVVQGVYHWITKKLQPVYDQFGTTTTTTIIGSTNSTTTSDDCGATGRRRRRRRPQRQRAASDVRIHSGHGKWADAASNTDSEYTFTIITHSHRGAVSGDCRRRPQQRWQQQRRRTKTDRRTDESRERQLQDANGQTVWIKTRRLY